MVSALLFSFTSSLLKRMNSLGSRSRGKCVVQFQPWSNTAAAGVNPSRTRDSVVSKPDHDGGVAGEGCYSRRELDPSSVRKI